VRVVILLGVRSQRTAAVVAGELLKAATRAEATSDAAQGSLFNLAASPFPCLTNGSRRATALHTERCTTKPTQTCAPVLLFLAGGDLYCPPFDSPACKLSSSQRAVTTRVPAHDVGKCDVCVENDPDHEPGCGRASRRAFRAARISVSISSIES